MLLGRLARRYAVRRPASRAVPPPRRAGWWASAGSPTRARTAPSCSSPARRAPRTNPAFKSWEGRVQRVHRRARHAPTCACCACGSRTRGRSSAFHWRGAPDEDAAHAQLEEIAAEAEADGLATHWGRKVLEVRPPVPIDKGLARARAGEPSGARAALFGGDDATDLDAFDALDALVAEGGSTPRCGSACAPTRGRRQIVERADMVVDGVGGFAACWRAGRGVRFRDFLRVGGAAVRRRRHRARGGLGRRRGREETTHARLRGRSSGGSAAALAGLWLGPPAGDHARASRGLLADARSTHHAAGARARHA